MRGYWYYSAITTGAAILYVISGSEWLLLLVFLWLLWLAATKKFPLLPFFISLFSLCFFSIYIPKIPQETGDNQLSPISGEINGSVDITEDYIQFLLADSSYNQNQNYLVVYFFDEAEDLSSVLPNHNFLHGASCTINQTPELPSTKTNPAQFNYQQFLLQKNIQYQVVIEELNQINCNGSEPLSNLHVFRQGLIDHMVDTWSDFTASWLNAIVFGDDSMMDEETEELFQRWSLSHIIAISGSNITLIIAIGYLLLVKGNLLTKEKAQTFLVGFLPIYGVLAGGEPSVWRAVWMVTLFLVLQKIRKKFLYTDIFSIVFLSLVVFDPYIVYEVGFQFSFAVTFAILLSTGWVSQSKSALWNIIQISFVSQMAILPLQLHYFYIFQPLSILLNVIVIPYFTIFVIPLMYILTLLSFLPKQFIFLLDTFFQFIHSLVISVLIWIDTYLYFPLFMDGLSLVGIVVYFLFFFRFMFEMELNRTKLAFLSGVLFCLPIIIEPLKPYLSDEGMVTMFDIGQGDAILIETPYRKDTILIDAGSSFNFEDMEPSRSVYKQILRSYFYSSGITHLDAIILSHEDMDHIGSVMYILGEISVGELIVSEFFDEEVLAEIKAEHPEQVIRMVRGGQIIQGDFTNFYVLSPMENQASANDNSLVLYTELGESWLFTGDIGADVERRIITSYPHLTVDILKVAHHGSNTSSDAAFVEHISPSVGLISVGRNNRFGHPSPQVIDTFASQHIQLFRTDEHGAIQYIFSSDHGTFSTYAP